MDLQVIHADETYTHIALAGKLDVGGVAEIENKFLDQTDRKKSTVVDISGMTFLGSMGLRIFLNAAKTLSRDGKKFILLNPKPMVMEVLEASGIVDILSVEHDEAAAVAQAQS